MTNNKSTQLVRGISIIVTLKDIQIANPIVKVSYPDPLTNLNLSILLSRVGSSNQFFGGKNESIIYPIFIFDG